MMGQEALQLNIISYLAGFPGTEQVYAFSKFDHHECFIYSKYIIVAQYLGDTVGSTSPAIRLRNDAMAGQAWKLSPDKPG